MILIGFMVWPAYLVVVAMPSRKWLAICVVVLGGYCLYGGMQHRGVPCGIAGNVLNIPENQESSQAAFVSVCVAAFVRLFTLYLRDRKIGVLARTAIHVAGAFLALSSFSILHFAQSAAGVSFCFE